MARALVSALEPLMSVDLVTSDSAPGSVDEYDLVVVGGPTHAFSMTRATTRETAAKEHGAAHVPARGTREWIGEL